MRNYAVLPLRKPAAADNEPVCLGRLADRGDTGIEHIRVGARAEQILLEPHRCIRRLESAVAGERRLGDIELIDTAPVARVSAVRWRREDGGVDTRRQRVQGILPERTDDPIPGRAHRPLFYQQG